MSTLIIDARRIAAAMQPDLCSDCKRSILHRVDVSLSPKIGVLSSLGIRPLPETNQKYNFAGYLLEHTAAYAKNLGALYWFDTENSILLTGSPEVVIAADDKVRWLFGGHTLASQFGRNKCSFEEIEKYRRQALLYAFLLQVNGYEQPNSVHAFYYGSTKTLRLRLREESQASYGGASHILLPALETSEPEIMKADFGAIQQVREVLATVRETYDKQIDDINVSCRHCRTEQSVAC